MDKPVIGITTNILISEGGTFPGIERNYVNHNYVHSVIKAGGVPLLLPALSDEPAMKEQLIRLDGIILSGGSDINPLLYGEEPDQKLEFVLEDRDEYELKLVRLAHELKKPVFGICRGIQVINVAFGGTLFQDIFSQSPGCHIKHFQSSRSRFAGHTVDLMPDTQLYEILEQKTVPVNSYHHQSVKAVAPGFVVTALSKDGIIEAIEKPSETFLLGVQWHPELLVDQHPLMLKLFKRLIAAAKKS